MIGLEGAAERVRAASGASRKVIAALQKPMTAQYSDVSAVRQGLASSTCNRGARFDALEKQVRDMELQTHRVRSQFEELLKKVGQPTSYPQ